MDSIMYGYFAVMGTKHRRAVAPYAIYITLLQLVQMLVGMFVTMKAVQHQAEGEECHVNKTNSILGLTMDFSYFVLFFKLFIENYVTQTRKQRPAGGLPAKKKSIAEVTRSLSRKITKQMVPQTELEDEDDGEENKTTAGESKKIN